MVVTIRKKSPRAPSISLSEALDRALKIYEKERIRSAPIEVIANNMGFKSANNGSALAAIASLRYFGLLERPQDGVLAVSKDVESFLFAPNEERRKQLLSQFLKQPPLYAELLDRYAAGLPSDANLKYELINRGFAPASADSVLSAFKASVSFVGYYEPSEAVEAQVIEEELSTLPLLIEEKLPVRQDSIPIRMTQVIADTDEEKLDRIPVRLTGGRKAWLLIPTPFFDADKIRLKAQIDLLLSEEEEESKV